MRVSRRETGRAADRCECYRVSHVGPPPAGGLRERENCELPNMQERRPPGTGPGGRSWCEFRCEFLATTQRFQLRLPIRPPTAIGERCDPAVFVPLEDLVAGLPRNAERGAQRRHLLALEQAGHKPEPLVHDVTLLPRHAPSCEGAKVSPMCPEYS